MVKYLTTKEIKELYNLHISTLHRWSKEGIIHPIKTPGGHRRYDENELLAPMGKAIEIKGNRCAIYARVSTKKQANSGNLTRQLERLKGIAKRRKYTNVVFEEVDDRPSKEPQEELVEDMIAIVTGFSARLYGKRSGRVAKKLAKVIESEVTASENNSEGTNPGTKT